MPASRYVGTPRSTDTRQVSITGYTRAQDVIGLRVRVRLYDSTREGVVERLDGIRPIVRFEDGTWAYGDRTMRVIKEG
jgi:hypothetical protein